MLSKFFGLPIACYFYPVIKVTQELTSTSDKTKGALNEKNYNFVI